MRYCSKACQTAHWVSHRGICYYLLMENCKQDPEASAVSAMAAALNARDKADRTAAAKEAAQVEKYRAATEKKLTAVLGYKVQCTVTKKEYSS